MKKFRANVFFFVLILVCLSIVLIACSSGETATSYSCERLENNESVSYALTVNSDGTFTLVRTTPYATETYTGTYSQDSENGYTIKVTSAGEGKEVPSFLTSAEIIIEDGGFSFLNEYVPAKSGTSSGTPQPSKPTSSVPDDNKTTDKPNSGNKTDDNGSSGENGTTVVPVTTPEDNSGNDEEPHKDAPCYHPAPIRGNFPAPTCTEVGYNCYYCPDCGEIFEKTELPATGHEFDDEGICTKCGVCSHINTEKEDDLDPTCTEDGYFGKTICTKCEEVVIAREFRPKLGHNYENRVCTRCGEVYLDGEYTGNGTSVENIYQYYSVSTEENFSLELNGDDYVLTKTSVKIEIYQIEVREEDGRIQIDFSETSMQDIDDPEAEENGFTKSGDFYVKTDAENGIEERITPDAFDPGEHTTTGTYVRTTTSCVVTDGIFTFNKNQSKVFAGESAFVLDLEHDTCTEETGLTPVKVTFYVNGYIKCVYNFEDRSLLSDVDTVLPAELCGLDWYKNDTYSEPFDHEQVSDAEISIFARVNYVNTFVYGDARISPDSYVGITNFNDVKALLLAEANVTVDGAGHSDVWTEGGKTVTSFTVPDDEWSLDDDHEYVLNISPEGGYALITVTYGAEKTFYFRDVDDVNACEGVPDAVTLLSLNTTDYEYSGTKTDITKQNKTYVYCVEGYFDGEFKTNSYSVKTGITPGVPDGYAFKGYKIGATVYQNLDSLQSGETAKCVYEKGVVTLEPTLSSAGTYTLYRYTGSELTSGETVIPALNTTDYDYEVTTQPTTTTTGVGTYTHETYGSFTVVIPVLTVSYNYAVSIGGDFFTYTAYADRASLSASAALPGSETKYYSFENTTRYTFIAQDGVDYIYDENEGNYAGAYMSAPGDIEPYSGIYAQSGLYLSVKNGAVYFSTDEDIFASEEVADFDAIATGIYAYPIKNEYLTLTSSTFILKIGNDTYTGSATYDQSEHLILLSVAE